MSDLDDFEDIEEENEEYGADEVVVVLPVADSGAYTYVCSECGSYLTEIPYYNRYYCENCGLHY